MTAKIKLNAASGGGSFSLQAPSSSSNNRVFTLPDSADATLLTSTSSVGKVLQVIQSTLTSQATHASSSLGDLGLSASITPQTNSKVLALVEIQASVDYKTNRGYGIALLRGSSSVYTDPLDYAVHGNTNASVGDGRVKSNWHILDSSPGGDGSSSLTYKIQVKTHGGRQIVYSEGGNQCSLTLIEVGA
jgi:hypothetical protein